MRRQRGMTAVAAKWTHLWMQVHPASPACHPSGEVVKPWPAMLEPACTSPTEHRPAAHEGEMAWWPQYTRAHNQPGTLTAPTQTRQQCEDTHVESWGGSGTGHVKGHGEVQGGGYGGGQGSGNGTMNNTSGESWWLALKVLAEDGGHQCQGWPTNKSSDSPETTETTWRPHTTMNRVPKHQAQRASGILQESYLNLNEILTFWTCEKLKSS